MTDSGYILFYTPRDANSRAFLDILAECSTLGSRVQKVNVDTVARSPVRYVPTIYVKGEKRYIIGKDAFEWIRQEKSMDLGGFESGTMAEGGSLAFSSIDGPGSIRSQQNFVELGEFEVFYSGQRQ